MITNQEGRGYCFEQYRLLIDSAHKMDERRTGSNNIYIAVNSILITALTQVTPSSFQIERSLLLFFLLSIGVMVCKNWLNVIKAYQKINLINYFLIKELEKHLPSYVFSLRMDLVEENFSPSEKNVSVLKKEFLIPSVFLVLYLLYLLLILTMIGLMLM